MLLATAAAAFSPPTSTFIKIGRREPSVSVFPSTANQRHHSAKNSLLFENYGRGAEIWPPANEEPIRLENSFPNGIIPDSAVEVLSLVVDQQLPTQESPPKRRRRRYLPRGIRRILKRAANAQEETASDAPSPMDKTPVVLAGILVLTGMIKPLDALLVSFFTGYFTILFMWARSTRSDGYTPVLPSLPPQGHVPSLVSNPLGPSFTTYSLNYDYWLKAGAILGLLAPIVMMLRYALFTQQMECARACARPVFFMCCQAISEAVSRRSLTPLPLRILIPVSYNTIRLGYLWNWVFLPEKLGAIGLAIAVANLVYWCLNLFGFLIPIATVRYMRAHFFAVEAEEVNTRLGMGDSAGIQF